MAEQLTPNVTPEYGQGQVAEAQQAAAPLAEGKMTPQEPVVAAEPQVASTPQVRPVFSNPIQRLPASLLYAPRGKTPVQQQYDVGLLWDVLAQQSNDPMIRSIARTLTGKG
jgi:hypothetical protein